MEQQELRDWEARCIQEEPPACRAGCPLSVDARAFTLAMAGDDIPGARAILEKSMPLAGIVARLCEAPCENFCVRGPLGGPLAIGGLERVCVAGAPVKGKVFRLPPRNKKVTVIGGGPSSLTVAFDLAKKGYAIALYHQDPTPGGWLGSLPEAVLPAAVLEEELKRLVGLGVEFYQVADRDAIHGAGDATYIGQDDSLTAGHRVDLTDPDLQTFALAEPGLFTGGLSALDHPYRFITDVSQGREAAVSIDRYLQGASLTASRVALRHGHTELFTETKDVAIRERVVPADPGGFSREEAVREAGRCINCQCLECVRHCAYLAEYKAYPKTYARRVYNNSAIVKGIHQANHFINSCSLCGQCETICPKDFSMADLCLEARQQMVRENRMPASAHWFALEEMRAATGETALARHAPGQTVSSAMLFPGCQLAGIRPEQTLRLYERMLELEPATGIWLDCCGAPGHWAGRTEEFSAMTTRLEEIWVTMGRPKILMACSTCLKIFREHLPQIEVASVWTMLAQKPVAGAAVFPALALSDPCTSRHDEETRSAVRSLLAATGQALAPLPMSGAMTECCGFGGLMEGAAPATAKKVREARVAESDEVFLTYCAMCRDQLAKTGRPVLHLLDILFADTAHPAGEAPASISARRANRRMLKAEVLSRYPEAEGQEQPPWLSLNLDITNEVAALLEERRILEDDIRQVLYKSNERGAYFAHGASDRRIASARLGEVTFWVEYKLVAEVYHIDRCWSHRMVIRGGGERA
ncbi:MAG: heterodisulfide reductase-related iron-sulfur binding cluster [Desulforhopalus sp.]|nr:heterodisulfide reductase-related iron-sulfur binding cluster [Desulforhopalus sp.]